MIGLEWSLRVVEQSKFPRRTHVWWTVSGRFHSRPNNSVLAGSVTVRVHVRSARTTTTSTTSATGLPEEVPVRGGKNQPRRSPAPGHGQQGPRCREEARQKGKPGPA